MFMRGDLRPVAVYSHWPFCTKLCPYCNFNKTRLPPDPRVRNDKDHLLGKAMALDLAHELSLLSQSSERPVTATSLHFGGGTPSLMPPHIVSSLSSVICERVPTGPNFEVALECSPSSVTAQSMLAYRRAGVTRVSLGIQSIRADALSFLGRDHSPARAFAAIADALRAFDGPGQVVSADLMFGLPGQTPEDWEDELCAVLDVTGDGLKHLSAYELTYEPGTPLWRDAKRKGVLKEVTGNGRDDVAAMYEATVRILAERTRLAHYEVSNYALPGCESRHNLAYWRGWDYVGVGPGAHGRTSNLESKTRSRRVKIANVDRYIRQCLEEGHGTASVSELSYAEMLKELVVVGMRIREGVSFTELNQLSFGKWDVKREVINWEAVTRMIELDLLNWNEETARLKPSERGLAVVDSILAEILV
ncbi:hypothetical protein BC830DRAFT_1102338 [Chytriomyces sp. MP71]|nr:hypothetical protein BC830DRAFT_1102338 [Chytriomyces sp. MP71]